MSDTDTTEQATGAATEVAPGFFMQPKITGYRQLTNAEVSLMNEGKALAEQCGAFIEKLRNFVPEESADIKPGATLDQRWISIGATDLQRGFMSVVRGIAQPTTF